MFLGNSYSSQTHCQDLHHRILHTTPGIPVKISDIRLWKCSGADDIPNGSLWKRYRPKGVMKVVSREDSSERGICQKPAFASSFDITLAPASWARTWSTAGRGCCSRCTLSFSYVNSTQMRTFSLLFGTTTMPEHQSVGSSIFEMTPSLSMR